MAHPCRCRWGKQFCKILSLGSPCCLLRRRAGKERELKKRDKRWTKGLTVSCHMGCLCLPYMCLGWLFERQADMVPSKHLTSLIQRVGSGTCEVAGCPFLARKGTCQLSSTASRQRGLDGLRVPSLQFKPEILTRVLLLMSCNF